MDKDLQELKDTLGFMGATVSNLPKLIRITMDCLDEMQCLREEIDDLKEVNNKR